MRMQTSTEQRRQKIDELERAFLQTVGESTSCGETTADEPGKATTDAGRPGAGAYADEAEKEAKFASMKSVIGIDIERETLQALLEAADGDEELALDVFFAESSRAAHRLGIKSALADDAGQLMAGPRRPYEDLALLLGNGVDAELLAPIATEFSGDLARAVEAYFERTAEHASSAALRARKAAENAEKYYTRPAGRGEAVYCNVYHLHWKETDKSTGDQRAATEENVKGKAKARSNSGLPGVGLGIYHSGLEMYGREVSFGYADGGLTGVFEVPAKCAGGVMPRTTFKESVLLGFMFRSPFEVDHILQRFAAQYRGDAYHLVRCNCNHFTGELAEALVGKGIPSYVNRTANIGKGILGVMALPSQAMGGIFSGLKRAVSNKEGKSRQQQLHDSSGGGAEPGVVTEGLGGLGGDGAAKAGQPAASPVCNLPVASPAASGPMPFAPTHHLVPAYQKRPGAGAAGATPPPRAGAHADQDILFV